MRKATAVTAVCLGVVAITFAVASHLHLRNLATASPPVDVSRFVEFPILSIGMLDTRTPAMIDAATFARSLAYRIYATGVAGFVFLLIGGCLFRSRQRSDAHELQAPC